MIRKTTLILMLTMSVVSFCFAAVHHVTPQTEFINSVIENAAERDTILFDIGIYTQRIVICEKVLTLGSLDIFGVMDPPAREITVIDGMYLEDDRRALITIDNSVVKVTGLKVINNMQHNSITLEKGGGFTINESDVTLENCVISGHYTTIGSGIHTTFSNTIIENCIIEDNNSGYAAGIYSSEGLLEIHNSRFTNNAANRLIGGTFAIYRVTGGIYNSVIEEGYAGIYAGGAIISGCQDFVISDNIWRNNYCDDEAGAIQVTFGDNINIINNVFDGNVSGGSFHQSNQRGVASAICVYSIERMNINGNTFIGNKSSSVVKLCNGIIHFSQNMFLNNMGPRYVALSLADFAGTENSAVTAIGNVFAYTREEDNHRTNYSGAIGSASGTTLTLRNNDFTKNSKNAIGYPRDHGEIIIETNYFGDISGPFHETLNPDGLGDTIDVDLEYENFATEPFWTYGLEFNQEVIDFGFVTEGTSATETVELTNNTDHDLSFNYLNLFYDNVFSIPNLDSTIISSGESITIPITFQPEDSINYFNVLSTVSTDQRATGSTIEILGTGITNTAADENGFIPTSFHVSEPYPNPFNCQTRLKVFITEPSNLNIAVYDINGRLIKKIADGYCNRGDYKFDLDFKDQCSGIYFARIITDNYCTTKKLLLIQ